MLVFLTAFLVSACACWMIAKSSSLLHSLHRKDDLLAVQAAHTRPTLRLAGVALSLSMWLSIVINGAEVEPLRLLLVAALPLFFVGLLEDVGVHQSPRRRIAVAIVSGVIFSGVTGTYLYDPGLFFLRPLFEYWPLAVGFTLFVTAGLIHAFNLIDGLNGLAGSVAIVACAGISAISYRAGSSELILPSLVICGALLGFLALNFPFGRLFLGDSGAYTTGFLLSWLALEGLRASPLISPWAMLMMFFWPIADTLLTIWRRLKAGQPVSHPDRMHFHQVVMRLISIYARGRVSSRFSNPMATIAVVPLMTVPPFLGVLFWDNNSLSLFLFCLFLALFAFSYIYLVKVGWAVKRHQAKYFSPKAVNLQ